MADEDLLRPTLSGTGEARALYNSTGFFVSAFFGGPMGAGVYGLANSHRLGRLRQDLPVVVVLVAGCYWLLMIATRQGWLEALTGLLDDRSTNAIQLLLRGLALACFGAIYFMHREFYRAARVAGVESTSGWVPGIVAVILGLAANSAYLYWFQRHH